MSSFPKVLVISILFVNSLHISDSANILIFCPIPFYSHQLSFIEVWKELLVRGHSVTLVTTFPNEVSTYNFTLIDASVLHRAIETSQALKASETSRWFVWNLFRKLMVESERLLLPMDEIQDMIQNHSRYKFDVVIVECGCTNLFMFSRLFNCPAIGYTPMNVFDTLNWHLGNQINHVSLPDMNCELFEARTFLERMISALQILHELIKEYWIYLPEEQAVLDEFFGKDIGTTSKELKQDIDLLLVQADPFMQGVRSVGPTTIMVSGGVHLHSATPLSEDLKSYLDNATEGCIYLSLGTIIQSSNVDANLLDVMVDVLSKLPYKVLWKIEDEYLQRKPDNVKTIKWGPQQDILRHPNIKLFISQGGIQSLEEALFCHVPNLIMSFFGDQHKNGQLVTAKGIGKMIQHKPRLDKLELQSTILELINNPKYKATAKRLSTLMNDTYMTGLEKSVWWIEYVIRNNGTKELRNPAAKLPFWQYYALDVIGFILFSLAVSIWLLVFIAKSILGIFTADEVMESKKKR